MLNIRPYIDPTLFSYITYAKYQTLHWHSIYLFQAEDKTLLDYQVDAKYNIFFCYEKILSVMALLYSAIITK